MPRDKENSSLLGILGRQNTVRQALKTQDTNEEENKQGVPLTPNEQHQSEVINQHIEKFKESLDQRSNLELKRTAEQLETVEREMLMQKIDNELQTIKEAAIQPGASDKGPH
ncbi:hypothetical protein AXX12_02630 [Anaerosporomusa subterranea]|jgi:RNase H-fold protein (predicted Holliday junction resolvase)|uniref:Uncharacterized protein n=1 Tax=Anaerosporomusa subterranea TaxID=1794912 RepID=A0A154BSS6_ANASB|nr:hypothetical protein [Anaerosporomusa subterranea]KYZ77053.1 hypothetical protein AXX12_02630 [Anaerosporomusa subterranea]